MQHQRPRWLIGILFVLVIGAFVRGLFPVHYQMIFVLIAVLGAISFTWAEPDSLRTQFAPLDYVVFALAGLYLLATLWAANPRDALQEGLKQVFYATGYWIVSRSLRQSEERLWFLRALALVVATVALGSVILATGLIPYRDAVTFHRLSGPFQYPNVLASYLLVGLGLILSIRASSARLTERIFWGSALYTTGLVFLFTYSRIAWAIAPVVLLIHILLAGQGKRLSTLLAGIPAAVAVIAVTVPVDALLKSENTSKLLLWFLVGAGVVAGLEWLFYAAQGRRWLTWGLAASAFASVGLAALVLVPRAGFLVQRLLSISAEDSSLQLRFWTYADAVRAWWHEAPLTGLGGAGWSALYLAYRRVDFVAKLVHSSALETLTEVGVQGLLLWLAVWFLGYRYAWRLYRRTTDTERGLLAGAMTGLGGMLLHSLLDFDLWYPAATLLMYTLIGHFRSAEVATAPMKDLAAQALRGRRLAVISVLAAGMLALMPLTAAVWLDVRSEMALARQEYQVAFDSIALAARLDPLNGRIAATHGDMLLQIGLQQGSRAVAVAGGAELRRAVRLEPFNPDYRLLLANYHMVLQEDEKAFEVLDEASRLDPKTADTYYRALRHGMLLVRKNFAAGDYEKAKAYLNRVDEILQRLDQNYREQPTQYSHVLLRMTPNLEIVRAQYLAFRGQLAEAKKLLLRHRENREESTRQEALYWLAVIDPFSGGAKPAKPPEQLVDPSRLKELDRDRQSLGRALGRS